mmetsp:Transcript_36793/g.103800  ORF Transcript_36793/g.103800 Transcript_36793/m.103800 type:complete len:111 (-) Transcript_36793:321-653(-)
MLDAFLGGPMLLFRRLWLPSGGREAGVLPCAVERSVSALRRRANLLRTLGDAHVPVYLYGSGHLRREAGSTTDGNPRLTNNLISNPLLRFAGAGAAAACLSDWVAHACWI